jgi:tol-pal system protein YbgF
MLKQGGKWMKWGSLVLLLAVPLALGCVTLAEHRKVERAVMDLQRASNTSGGSTSRERLADLAARLDALEQNTELLIGRVEVAEHHVNEALQEARAARQQAASGALGEPDAVERAAGAAPEALSSPSNAAPVLSEQLAAYKAARAKRSSNDWNGCVDRLGEFLQTYPSSAYADDAAYWQADCYFQQGNYKVAIVRFDDVVRLYPQGNKAADALYREGETLIRLGPGYNTAAQKAFERVLGEYPESDRSIEARQQLKVLGTQ